MWTWAISRSLWPIVSRIHVLSLCQFDLETQFPVLYNILWKANILESTYILCVLSLFLHSVLLQPHPSISSSRSGKIWNLAGDKLKTDDGSGKCGGEPLRTDQTDKDKAEGGAMCQGKAHSKRGMVESWQQNCGAKTLQICLQALF